MKACIISGSSAQYFPILVGLLNSIAQLTLPKIVLNMGMTAEQVGQLTARDIKVVTFDYPHAYPLRDYVAREFPGFGVMLARPYLNEIAEGYDVLLWLDADTWVQDPRAIVDLLNEAGTHGVAASPEIDRSYFRFTPAGYNIWDIETAAYTQLFGPELAAKMRHAPNVNSGIFAARCDSKIWALWRKYLQQTLKDVAVLDETSRAVEQMSFNLTVTVDQIPLRRCSPVYNWLVCLATPAWHAEKNCLVDPLPPYEPLKIVHITTHFIGRRVKLPLVGHPQSNEIEVPTMEFSMLADVRAFFAGASAGGTSTGTNA